MSFVSKSPFQLQGRYAERNKWEVLDGAGDFRVTGVQIVEDEGILDGWKDKVVLVTGVSSGIGVETVRAIAKTGATVYGTARDLDKARKALGPLTEAGTVKLLHMDQCDLESVKTCTNEFRAQCQTLNVIINNAAVMNTPETRSKQGYELQLMTNHLSHFLLFYRLKDILLASSTASFHSRVVSVSSAAHRYAEVRLDNINWEGEYNGWLAYGSSKTANIYMCNQIERLYGASGLHGYSVHPGSFVSPNLQHHSQVEMALAMEDPRVKKYLSSLEQACATSVYGAVSSEIEGKGALYLEGASVSTEEVPPGSDAIEYGYAPWAYDEEKEAKTWELTKKLVGVE